MFGWWDGGVAGWWEWWDVEMLGWWDGGIGWTMGGGGVVRRWDGGVEGWRAEGVGGWMGRLEHLISVEIACQKSLRCCIHSPPPATVI